MTVGVFIKYLPSTTALTSAPAVQCNHGSHVLCRRPVHMIYELHHNVCPALLGGEEQRSVTRSRRRQRSLAPTSHNSFSARLEGCQSAQPSRRGSCQYSEFNVYSSSNHARASLHHLLTWARLRVLSRGSVITSVFSPPGAHDDAAVSARRYPRSSSPVVRKGGREDIELEPTAFKNSAQSTVVNSAEKGDERGGTDPSLGKEGRQHCIGSQSTVVNSAEKGDEGGP